jgi:GT2 family glycosyltransferase
MHHAVRDLRVSVVIPSWDGAAVLGPCLDSVSRQHVTGGIETIVVDDGSTDHTTDLLARYPGIRVLSNAQSVGYSAACNQGAADAHGAVLVFLNSDTELLSGDVLERLAVAAEQPNIGVVGPMLQNPDGTLQPSCAAYLTVTRAVALMTGLHRLLPDRLRARVAPHTWSHDRSRDVDWVKGAALAIRADRFRELGGFWPTLFGEETDLAFRARGRGLRVRFEREARVMHIGGYSIGRRLSDPEREARIAEAELRFLRNHYGRQRRTVIRAVLFAGFAARAAVHGIRGRRDRAAAFRAMARVLVSSAPERTR